MTIQRLNFGTGGNNDGEVLRTAFLKLDANDADLDARVTSLETDGVPALAEHIADTSGAHDASAISFTHTAAGAVFRTLRAKVAERPVSVQDFLGVDPTGTTDSTAGIAAAITAAGVGGTLYFPAGLYIFSDHDADGKGLIQLSGQKWFGDSPAASILRLNAATTDIDVLITTDDFAEDYSFEDMQIDGNRANITPAVDLYNHFNMLAGARGGKRAVYRNLLLANSWGRVLQTSSYYSVSEFAEDILVDGVWATNAGTKAISATQSRRVTIQGCFAEVNPYTAADHPWAIGDGNASSGSCFECNESEDVTICGNHGIQIGASLAAPGIRLVNTNQRVAVFGNTIKGASYLGFIQNANDVDFFSNIGRNIRGNGVAIFDGDGETGTCRRVRVHHNKIIDPTDTYVIIIANKSSPDPEIECYIYENDFIQISGSPTAGIYNRGIISPATGGVCLVYQWGNTFIGSIPNQLAGEAAALIQSEPWPRAGLSSVNTTAALTALNTADAATKFALRLEGKRASPANNDSIALPWWLTDDAGNQEEFARLTCRATNVANGSEASAFDIQLRTGGTLTNRYFMDSTVFRPASNDAAALGAGSISWADLYLASGGIINWNNSDVTITHSANALAFAGATTNGYSFADGPIKPATNDGVALGVSGTGFSDAFFASGAVIDWNAGDVTITHSANLLAFSGAASGYTFDAQVAATSTTNTTPAILAKNTANAATCFGLRLEGDRATPANNDSISIQYFLSDSAGNQDEAFRLQGRLTNVTSGAESGAFDIQIISSGTLANRYFIDSTVFRPATAAAAGLGAAAIPWGPIFFRPGASQTPSNNGDVTFELTNNTTLTIKAKGSDGTVRSGTLTLS